MKLLLATRMVGVDASDKIGPTPLYCAAANGHEGVVKLVLEAGMSGIDARDAALSCSGKRARGSGEADA